MRISKLEIVALLIVAALAAYVYVPVLQQNRAKSLQAACAFNLTTIGQGLSDYMEANDARWPYVDKLGSISRHDPSWPILPDVLSPYINDRSVYRCPADVREIEDAELIKKFGTRSTWFETEGLSYEWLWADAYGGRRVGKEKLSRVSGRGKGRADQDLLSDFDFFHKSAGGTNILFADFVVRPANKDELSTE